MARITAKELIGILVGRGFLTKDQARDCIAAQKEALSAGTKTTILAAATKKGYLSESQKAEVMNIARAAMAAPAAAAPPSAAPAAAPPPPVAPAAAVPEIPGFTIETEIGRGAMGTVYLGHQTSLDRPVAIKVLSKSVSEDQEFVDRFLKEARTAARLNHPTVVGAIDAGETDGTYYFVMEYVEGEDVKKLLAREGHLSEERALQITDQIADALVHAESLDMVHRDIKPENIMLTVDGTAKLSDLGLARQMLDPSTTMAGKVIGTPYYMSTEQVEGRSDLDVRSDIYSLGATLYQMLTNDFPFQASSPTAVLHKHMTAARPDPSKINPDVSRPACALVRRMMAKDRARRPQSAEELKEMIVKTREGAVPSRTEGQDAPETKKSIPVVPLIAGGGALVLAAVLIFFIVTKEEEETPPLPEPTEVAVSEPEPVEAEAEPEPPKPGPEKKAGEALSAASDYWEEHPKSPLIAIERFDEVARKHPDTRPARNASSEASAIRLQIDGALTAIKGRTEPLAAEGDFRAAEQLYRQFLVSFPRDPWQKKAEEGVAEIRAGARKALQNIQEKARKLVADGKSEEALELFTSSTGKMTAETTKTLAEVMKELEKKIEKEEQAQRKSEALLADARSQAVKSLQDGGIEALMATCERLKEDSRFEEAIDLLS